METLLQAKKLRVLTFALATVFVVGLVWAYTRMSLTTDPSTGSSSNVPAPVEKKYVGRITFIDPSFYPHDEISHVLNSASGKEIILLVAEDEKLVVAEGLSAEVWGYEGKTNDGKEKVLMVTRIVIKNGTN